MPVGGIIAIVVGALAVVILLVTFLVWFVTTQLGALSNDFANDIGTNHEPLVQGERSTPVAIEPLKCSEPCFTGWASEVVAASGSDMSALGVFDGEYYLPPSSVHIEHIVSEREWLIAGTAPHFCHFTSVKAPLSTVVNDDDAWYDEESIEFNSTLTDGEEGTIVDQSVRRFATSDAASAHMVAMDSEIDECQLISIDYFDPGGEYDYHDEWDVTRSPALTLPSSVAAVGWVKSGEYDRTYTFDMQRGNVVIRTTMQSWSGATEQQFRGVVESMAARLGKMSVAAP
ncbi:MAG: EGFR-like transmembrane domain-containing protein [Microbacteriaceae bacterium]